MFRRKTICLTDMVKGQEGEDHIRNWIMAIDAVDMISKAGRNRIINTIE